MSPLPSPSPALAPPQPPQDQDQDHDPYTQKALAHRKPCTLCHTPRDVLVRCQIDATGKWHFVCTTGGCWKKVSGGVIDGDGGAGRECYRYGGMWKNKVAGVSAKKPKKKKKGKGGKGKKGEEGKKKVEGGSEGDGVEVSGGDDGKDE
ncbi:hypothetical protein MBLNU230_g1276t1 [Neophaeotheca triangularis]